MVNMASMIERTTVNTHTHTSLFKQTSRKICDCFRQSNNTAFNEDSRCFSRHVAYV